LTVASVTTSRCAISLFDSPLEQDLFPEAKSAWRQIVAELAQAGTLSSTDALVVELAAVAVDRGRE